MSKLYYPAVFHEADPDEKGYWVEFPDLPGCITEGNTLEEAVEMAKNALGSWFTPNPHLETEDFPTPSKPSQLLLDNHNDCIMLIEYDSIAWAKKYNGKAVKKTLTIPAWLNELAEKSHINYSQTLQEALVKKLDI